MDRPGAERPFEPLPAEVESALVGLCELSEVERQAGVETLCDRHPALAGRIRAVARTVGQLGLERQPLPDPDHIGPYRVLEKLGEGGMGAVYLCQQDQPVRRRVAVKLIKIGMATREVLARFEAERQALAMMNHPGIARVLDAGATTDGRSYFVMEHVAGVPLDRFCDDHRLAVRQRLRLFVQIAQAVQHAHHKGIIHRDLKPQNVLVTLQDGKPVPKVIDFGLAKATQSHLTEMSYHTQQGRVLGTLGYMSPEQADLTGLDIDTRTDVYSLGVILYELLTGVLPFDSAAMRQAGLTEVQRILKEEEPPKPSTMVPAGEAAKRRHSELRHLVRELRGELDWITLKALEKDRSRRYATAIEFAGDVERYLQGEPVLAGPPNGWYRVAKYLRRHRGPLLAASAVIGALAIGLMVALHARNQMERALEARGAALTEAKEQRRLAQDEALKARESERRASAGLADFRRMADVKRLQDLVREADLELWPAVPAKVPAMGRWLAKVEELRSREALHRDKLTALELTLEKPDLPASEREEAVWQRDTEQALLAALSSLLDADWRRPTLAGVRKRIEDAQRAQKDLTETHAREWALAIATIADEALCPLYHGLELEPQLGLVPLGRNEVTGLYEFWHPASGEQPQWRGRDGKVRIDDATGIVFVLIPGGTFWMGAQKSGQNADPNARDDESPVRQVTLHPFFLARHELTQGQWQRWTGENPSSFGVGEKVRDIEVTLHNPVEHVSWEDCRRILGQMGLCLPTEAQWEYACRAGAGTATVYSTGNDVASLQRAANIADEGSRGVFPDGGVNLEKGFDDGHAAHAPVGSFMPNAWGLFDMHGNVWEWCRDCHCGYEHTPRSGDGGRNADGNGDRVIRGGSFSDVALAVRSAVRYQYSPDMCDYHLGVRPARAVQP